MSDGKPWSISREKKAEPSERAHKPWSMTRKKPDPSEQIEPKPETQPEEEYKREDFMRDLRKFVPKDDEGQTDS